MDFSPDAISAFLLKHPPGDFARGDLVLAPAISFAPLVLLVAAAIAIAWWTASRLRHISGTDRIVLGVIRTAVFLLIGICLLRPTLVLSRAIAQRNVLAVVLDDSRSMLVGDAADTTRIAMVQQEFSDSSEVVRRLQDRFTLRFYRASGDATPTGGAGGLTASGTRTDLATSLTSVREALADLPLAGIVLVSDGAQNGVADLDAEIRRLQANEIPVHTVGVGTERFARDVGIESLRLPREVLMGGQAPGELVLQVRGVTGQRLVLSTIADGLLVGRDTVRVPDRVEQLAVPIKVPALERGTKTVRVTVDPVAGEVTTLNNSADAVLRVRGGPEKILYVEAEPRAELPFIRRAVASDSALQVVALIRSGVGKFLRLGVDDSLELLQGFPRSRAELFSYRALVLGSVAASDFDADQMRMIQEFVGDRGGGLLALGGRRALGEGGYAGTPVDEVLPFVLDPADHGNDRRAIVSVRVTPTATGAEHPALALPGERTTDWSELPLLSVVNAGGRMRPGAVVLLEGAHSGGTIPVLSTQRYGRGQSAVFLPQDSWRWQLTEQLPVDDATHRAFWDRLLRWTVTGVPDQLELDVSPGITAPGEPVSLQVRVADSVFTPRDDAKVSVEVVPPDAPAFAMMLEADLGLRGTYHGTVTPTSTGVHRLRVTAIVDGDTLHTDDLLITDRNQADPGSMERDEALLAGLAARTGGRHYDIENLHSLPNDVLLTRSGVTARVTSDLWDAPLVFFLFITLLGLDWGWRRSRGLA